MPSIEALRAFLGSGADVLSDEQVREAFTLAETLRAECRANGLDPAQVVRTYRNAQKAAEAASEPATAAEVVTVDQLRWWRCSRTRH